MRGEEIPTEPRFDRRIAGYQAKHQRRRLWYKIVSALACVVVFCTTYALILPALTMETERVLDCPMEIHAHTAGCFGEAGELLCGQADFVLHTHGEFCYNADGELACTLREIEEHRHTAGCYSEEETLICGEQETAGHQHGEDCYETTLEPVCGRKETAGHQHDDGCYAERALLCTDETHEHTEDCYEQEPALICGHEAGEGMHIHDESCCEAVHTLICELAESESGHVHTDACYERETVLTCGEEEFSLHAHDSACYGADGALICGQLAVSAHTHTEDCCAYVQRPPEEVLEAEELLEQPALLAAKATGSSFTFTYDECKIQLNLVDEDGNELTADVEDIKKDKDKDEGKCFPFSDFAPEIEGYTYSKAMFVDGNNETQVYSVATKKYDKDKTNGEVGYVRFYTTDPIEKDGCINKDKDACKKAKTFTIKLFYQKNRAINTITFECEDTNGNRLTANVTPITNENTETEESTFRAKKPQIVGYGYLYAVINVNGEDKEVSSVRTNEGEHSFCFYSSGTAVCEKDENVTVKFVYEAADFSATYEKDNVSHTIYFILKNEAGERLNISPAPVINLEAAQRYRFSEIAPAIDGYRYSSATYNNADHGVVPAWAVETKGYNDLTTAFRVYKTESTTDSGFYSNDPAPIITLIYADASVPSNSFTMTYGTKKVTFLLEDTEGNSLPVPEGFEQNIVAEDSKLYIFGAADANTAGTNNIVENFAPEVEGYKYREAKCNIPQVGIVPAFSVATAGYASGFSTFRIYCDAPAGTVFYSRDEDLTITLTYSEPTDYTGDWAIVNVPKRDEPDYKGAMLSTPMGEDGSGNLTGKNVTVVEINGENCVLDNTVTVWTFEKQEDGTYHISTKVDGKTKYLTIAEEYNQPVTLEDTPQSISVEEGTGTNAGKVLLYIAGNDNLLCHVNLYNSEVDKGFGTWDNYGVTSLADNSWHLLCEVDPDIKGALNYNLGYTATSTKIGGYSISEGSTNDGRFAWKNGVAPVLTEYGGATAVSSTTQIIADGENRLYAPGAANTDGKYIYTCVAQNNNARQLIRAKLEENGGADAGKVFRFDGWTATVNGVTYTFAPGATATAENDGSVRITDGETSVTVPSGTMLTAKWKQISDIVLFFVNYGGSILDVEGNVTGRNTSEFTGIIGVGRIYFGDLAVGTDNKFATEADREIRAKFTDQYDSDSEETQIVMQYATFYDEKTPHPKDPYDGGDYYNFFGSDEGINAEELEDRLLTFIRQNETIDIKLSTVNEDRPKIVNENATKDNYEVRWYVLKDQADAWHIDGVMVAKTKEVTVTKTFSGLNKTQVGQLMTYATEPSTDEDGTTKVTSYQIPVKLGAGTPPQDYFTMTTNPPEDQGYYQYHDKEQDTEESYKWTMHTALNEKYTLSETNYDVNGYDVSTVVVTYFENEDGTRAYKSEPANTTTFTGGETTAVSFNNLYTLTGTGALAIHKSSSVDPDAALQGAKFELWNKNDYGKEGKEAVQTQTSNSRGSVYFSNLAEGTYILTESEPPAGYAKNPATWTVEVEKDEDDSKKSKVTVYENDVRGDPKKPGTPCYETGVSIKSYPIQNTPEGDTVSVTKKFTGLTADEMKKILKDSKAGEEGKAPEGYYIEISPDPNEQESAKGDITSQNLVLKDAAQTQEGFIFTWMLTDLDMNKTYQIVEHNYEVNGYQDVSVTATVNGTQKDVVINRKDKTATVSNVKFSTEQSDVVEITNRYLKNFALKINKVDKVTREELKDAKFDIYGPYLESTDTSTTVAYGENGGKTAHYIATYVIGVDGEVTWEGKPPELKFGSEYVLVETKAPAGYVLQSTPHYFTVTVGSEGYAHGVYTLTVENSKGSLPETGGAGTLPFILGGALLAAGSLLYGYQLRRRRERRSTP